MFGSNIVPFRQIFTHLVRLSRSFTEVLIYPRVTEILLCPASRSVYCEVQVSKPYYDLKDPPLK